MLRQQVVDDIFRQQLHQKIHYLILHCLRRSLQSVKLQMAFAFPKDCVFEQMEYLSL